MYGEDVIDGTRLNNVRFIKPVYPRDELHNIVEVINKQARKNDTGILTVSVSTLNDKKEKILEENLFALLKQ